MPDIAALTVADGIPVNHTFAVIGTNGQTAQWADKAGGISIGYPKITHEVRQAKSSTGANSVLVSIELPTVSTVNGVNTRARLSTCAVRFNFAQDSTLVERKDLVGYLINFLSNTTVRPTVYDTEAFF